MQSLPKLMPQASLSVRAVPPQLSQLAGMLGLEAAMNLESRADMKMAKWLPEVTGDAWLNAKFAAALPGLPPILPSGGGPLLKLTARLALVAMSYPIGDLKALHMEIKQAIQSIAVSLLPFNAQVATIPKPQMANMVLAARLTLALRAQGLCPMAMANVDMQFAMAGGFEPSSSKVSASANFAASLATQPFPPFALPLPSLNLAMTMEALAPAAELPPALGLPPISHPDFAAMAMQMMAGLASMPPLPIDPTALLADLTTLSDLSAIEQAFGEDAMTSAGVARVNAMLNFVGGMSLPPIPLPALDLQAKLDVLPSMEAVRAGALMAEQNAASIASTLTLQPPMPPILPLMEALEAFKLVLQDALGEMPTGPCGSCQFPKSA